MHSCNVTSSDNSRITAGPTGGPISPSGHLAMNLFDQGFGFGLCPSPYPHLVNLRTSAFADSPSPLRRAGIIWLPQVQSLWSIVFVVVSSLRGLRWSGRAWSPRLIFGSSCLHTVPKVAPPTCLSQTKEEFSFLQAHALPFYTRSSTWGSCSAPFWYSLSWVVHVQNNK